DFQKFLAGLGKPAAEAVATVIGAFAGAFAAIKATWSMLPAALGDIVYSGANLLIEGVEKMINGVIALANGMIASVNGIAKKLGLSISLPELSDVHIQRLNNQYEGAAKAVGDVAKKAFNQTFKTVHDGVIDTFGDIAAKSIDVAQERIEKSVPKDDKRGGAGARASEAATPRDFGNVTFKEPASVAQDAPVDGVRPAAVNVEGLTTFVDPISKSLDELIEKLTKINALAPELGKQFEAAFGKTGKAMSGVLTSFSAYSLEVAKIDKEAGPFLSEKEQAKRSQAQIKGYASMAGAAKGFFEENSAGYKALEVAEIAFNTLHTLNTIKSMALETTSAAHTATAQGAKQASYGVTAYAHALAELPFPFNLLAGAAVIAALVQVGVAIKGKPSGGGSVPGANDMKTRQDAQGSGSVLGDDKAKSESLEKALTHAQTYENKDLEYGNAMVRSLRSIDDQISAVASALAKSFAAGGMLSTEGLGLGKTGTAATLSNLGFGKTTTRTLQDQGVQFDAVSLGEILDGGLSGSTYQQVLENIKKKAFGITTSNKNTVITATGALDTDFVDQITGLIRSLSKGVTDAAKALGETGIEEALKAFKVDLGKLSFKDMTGAQIEEALSAVFGKLGDDMAKAAVPAIAQFQKVGEGAFETLVRVARQYEVIDTTLKSVGMVFGQVGVASLEARERLVDLVGGLDNLTEQTAFFAENFLSEDERLQPVKTSVTDELTRLKLPKDLTREGFAKTVLGLDVSTREGADLYAALMSLAPAFDKVAKAAESAQKAVDDKKASILDQIDELVMTPAQLLTKSRAAEMKAVKELDATLVPFLENLWELQDAAEAARLATDRAGMYADLAEAQGRTEDAKRMRRDLALGQIKDPEMKRIQQQIWAAEDAAARVSAARDVLTQAYQREQDALQATKDKFKELSTSLRAFSASLTDTIAGTDPGARYRRTRESFLSTAAMARLGDPDAMGRLQNEGEAFTAASRDYVATSLDYLRDVGLVRSAVDEAADTADRQVSIAEQQLEALNRSVQGLIEINASVVSVAQAIASLQAANQARANAGAGSVGGMPTGATGGVGKYGGLLTDQSSDPSSADGKFVEGDLYDYDFHMELKRRIETQQKTNLEMGFDKWKEKQEAIAAEGEAWLDSVWGGYPGAYREAMERAGGIYNYNTPTWTENDYRAATGQPLQFAAGGGFEVGGSGPPDSKLFNLALSPGEAVNVRRRDNSGDETLVTELRRLREELADLRATSVRIATSNDKMERTLTNVTEGGRAMQTQAAA
uniref:hypothetical protein n=1 Tax=uncultured Caulobacter sp. TaxID=158749 RepID=UPI0025D22715